MICNGNFIGEKFPNTEFFLVRFQPEYRKIRLRKNSVLGQFSRSVFLRKQLAGESCHCFSKNVPSQMFGKVLNTPPKMILQSILNKDCNLEFYIEH